MNNIHNVKDTELRVRTLEKFLRVSILMADDADAGLKKRGLTRTRAIALWEIAARRPITQRELADALAVTPRNVTALVDALERTGFVVRKAHPTDRRAIVIALTKKGSAAVARLTAEKHALAETLFRGLRAADLATVAAAFDQIIAQLEAGQNPKAGPVD